MTDVQKARLKMRCNHRGMKEMDIILGRFCDAQLDDLPGETLDRLEALLEENDQDLLEWIMGRSAPPDAHALLIAQIRTFHGI